MRTQNRQDLKRSSMERYCSRTSNSISTTRRNQQSKQKRRSESIMKLRSPPSIKSLSSKTTSNEQIVPIKTMTLLISLAVLLLSCLAMVASATLQASSGANQDLDPHRVALESELGSLLMQPSQASGSMLQTQQDWRDKALASAIISRIMLDNMTIPCDGSPSNCGVRARNVANIQSDPVTSNEALELRQLPRLIDEGRLGLLLEQLRILNQQANMQDSAASSSNDLQGEFVISSSGMPTDQIANIKRAASNRFQTKLHLRGLTNDEGSIMMPNSAGQWAQTLNTNGHGAHELSLGSLKRPDSGSMLRLGDGPSYIKRPSSNNRQFEFGLGKRVASPSYSRYDFGLGKRTSGNQFQEYRYDFGLGR